MGLIGDIVALVAAIRDEADRGDLAQRERILLVRNEYLVPSYRTLRDIHEDYLSLYVGLKLRSRETEWQLNRVSDWWRDARRQLAAERTELLSLTVRGERGCHTLHSLGQDLHDDLAEALHEYVDAVAEYLSPAMYRRGPFRSFRGTNSSFTELFLSLFVMWEDLDPVDRAMTLEALQSLDEGPSHLPSSWDYFQYDEVTERLLAAPEDQQVIRSREDLLTMPYEDGTVQDFLRERGDFSDVESPLTWMERLADLHRRLGSAPRAFSWRAIVAEHASDRLASLEDSMASVQRHYTHARVLLDKAASTRGSQRGAG